MKNLGIIKKPLGIIATGLILGSGVNGYSQDNSNVEPLDSVQIGLYDTNNDGKRDSIYLNIFGSEGRLTYEFADRNHDEKFEFKREVLIKKSLGFPKPSNEANLEKIIEDILIRTKNLSNGIHTLDKNGEIIRYLKE